ncbi:IS110 family transposase [Pseudomonas sp. Marseille-P9899]|uniref:IS110 family transposase n=1 Tax=Pseudomonas sp. Marseille-P9899 TaxID=2730401 RepID=UPI00158E4266|nr:IS110 family transposase [Pseudomonas sp. Marseille-P9899]
MSRSAGIDVAARTAVLTILHEDRVETTKIIEQTAKGHQQAVALLSKCKPDRVVLEATGIYYLDLALALAEAGLPVSVINPKSSHHFAKGMLEHNKTDQVDARLLAQYGERMRPRLWTPPTATQLSLRTLGRHANRLVAARTRAKNQLHAYTASKEQVDLIVEDLKDEITAFDRRIERIRKAAIEQIESDQRLQHVAKAILAAPGIAEVSLISILAELTTLPDTLKSSQVSRHAGLDVRLTQSGTSVNKPGRLGKAGNTYLRSALFMPAMSAVRFDPYAKGFYDVLLGRGKKKMQAIAAVMRKYLTGIWACMRSGEPFDTAKLFSEKHLLKA